MTRKRSILVLLVGTDALTEDLLQAAAESSAWTYARVASTGHAEVALSTMTADALIVDIGPSGAEWLDRRAGDDPLLGRRTVIILPQEASATTRGQATRLARRTLSKPVAQDEFREALREILPSD